MVICLDLDGTLQSAGGSVGRKELHLLESIGAVWGILSSRSRMRSMDACAEMGVSPSFIECCRVNQRAEELREIRLNHPTRVNFIYVADRERDKEEAQRANWGFILASEFASWLEPFMSVATR